MPEDLVDIAENTMRGGFFLFAGNVLSTMILAIGSIIVARLLGPENYGLYSLALVVPSILVGLIDLGVSSAMTRFSAKLRVEGKNTHAARILRIGFFFKLLLGVSMSVVCFVFSDSLATIILDRSEMAFLVRLASPLILFQAILEVSYSAFIGLDAMKSNALVMNLQSTVKTILSPSLIIVGFGVIGALIGHISGYIAADLTGSFLLFKHYRRLGKSSHNGSSDTLKVMLSYGLPLYFSALLFLFLGQYRNIILAYYASDIEIGNFNVAVILSSTVNILVFPLSVLFPAFSRLNPNTSSLEKTFKLSVKYTAMAIVPASILVTITSRELVQTFYGQRYDSAPFFLSLYILTFLCSGLGSMVLGHLLNGLGETKTMFKANLIGALTLIPLALLSMMFRGVPGLIVALLISSISSLAYQLFIIAKKFNLRIDAKSSLKIYLAALLSAMPLLIFLQLSPLGGLLNLLLGGTLYLATFLTIAPITKAVTKEDLINLRTILNRITFLHFLTELVFNYEEAIFNLIKSKDSSKTGV